MKTLARLKKGRKRNGTEEKANKGLHLQFCANMVAVAARHLGCRVLCRLSLCADRLQVVEGGERPGDAGQRGVYLQDAVSG